jgi:sterol desaturase/sphingolipid hydroxylase (fatty acid hydroxylase superfamily)
MLLSPDRVIGVIQSTAFLILLCTLLERFVGRGTFSWKHRFPGFLFALLVPVFYLLVSEPLKWLWQLAGVPPLLRLDLPGLVGEAVAALILLLLVDFLRYWEHRFQHRFFWPVHAVHHSETNLSAATSYGHPLQFVSGFLLISLPLSLLDIGSILTPLWVSVFIVFMEFFIHSPTRIGAGPLRCLLVDAPYHRIHHSIEEQHFDRNFAITFSFWDRLFGTAWMPRQDEWPATGIREAPPPQTVAEMLAFPFRLWFAHKSESAPAAEPRLDQVLAGRPDGL